MDGDTLQLYCHGSEKNPNIVDGHGTASLLVTCTNVNFVTANGSEVDVEALTCSDNHEPHIVRTANAGCSDEGADGRTTNLDDLVQVQIGWQIDDTFHEQILLCIDEMWYATLWTTHSVLGAHIELRDTTGGRPSFRRDISGYKRLFPLFSTQSAIEKYSHVHFIKWDMYLCSCFHDCSSYTKKEQFSTVQILLGTNTTSDGELYIETSRSGTHYFARGHLSPDAAFVYNAFQDATYYFVNVAPQFQSFNNGAWKALEGAVRDYAAR